ncbi:MAG: sensor histidine kinase [bacterium]
MDGPHSGPPQSTDRDLAGRRLLAVAEEELQRVVLDIHDGPVQHLFAALGQLSLLRDQLATYASPGHLDTLRRAESLLESSLRDIRNIVSTLYAPEFAGRSIAEIADELVVQHEMLSGTDVTFTLDEPLPPVSPLVKIALYRVLQEALSNIRRHAGDHAAVIRLWSGDDFVYLDIEDHGRGFEPPPLVGPDATERQQHIGLRGMRDRAAMVGGELSVESRPGEGTRVCVRVPSDDAAGAR